MKRDPIAEAAQAALEGKLVVFPTDTVYGLGTHPDDAAATGRIFEAKQRSRDLTLPVLVPTTATAHDVALFDERAEALAAGFWPGALTLVLARSDASRAWDLGGDEHTIGVRLPAHPLSRAVLESAGPLAMTSANRSGEEPATTCEELRNVFGDLVEIYLCEQVPLERAASTVLDLAHGDAKVLRAGDIAPESIARLLPPTEALLDSRPSS